MRWWLLCFLFIALASCRSPSATRHGQINIRVSKDSQTIYISGLDYAILHDLKTDTLNSEAWQQLFSVYRMPADTETKDLQKQQPGKYSLTDTSILFKPDTAFAKGRKYFVRYYGGPLISDKTELLNAKIKLEGPHFTEVEFNF